MLRRLITGAVILLVLAALAWALWPRPVAIEMATVSRADVTITVEEEGKSRIRDVFTVSAPISGEVLRVDLHAGDEVVMDETVVASIRPPAPELLDARSRRVAEAAADAARAAVDLAAAEVRQAEAQLAFVRTELDRAGRLVKQGTISESAFEKAKLAVDTAEAAVASARASLMVRQRELERAEAALIDSARPEDVCCTEVKAPVSGRVLRVISESEKVVQAGTPLLEIGDPEDLEIMAEILSRDAVQIRPGAEAVIDGWGGPALPATVTRVDPSAVTKVSALGIEEQRVPVVLQIAGTAEQRARMGDGFRVVVRITIWKGSNLLTVPIGALFRDGGDWAVYTVRNGRAALTRITLGARNGTLAEVTGGLAEGDTIVLHPSDQIADGVRVASQLADQH